VNLVRNPKRFAIAVCLLLLAGRGMIAQTGLATGATQLIARQAQVASPGGSSQPMASQISRLAGTQIPNLTSAASAQNRQALSSPAGTSIRRDVPATRISSQPVSPVPSSDVGGVLQIPGVSGGSVPWSVVVTLTVLTLVPSILVCMTPFARLLIVFHFLRQALGLQTTPSNQTLIGLSLILTFFLMQPVATEIYTDALIPMEANQITAIDALGRAEVPMSHFMARYVRDKDVALFQDLAHEPRPASINDVSMRVLLPAYILSELKAGFQIGTVLFLPFLVVDIVVASITTSVGMMQLPPVVISTPLKLLLFLMVDGWHMLISSLMRSFQ
jgi:flagellar biosynthetic protein FliP